MPFILLFYAITLPTIAQQYQANIFIELKKIKDPVTFFEKQIFLSEVAHQPPMLCVRAHD
jgi:hypothetical protein